jgi:hypothetical protein
VTEEIGTSTAAGGGRNADSLREGHVVDAGTRTYVRVRRHHDAGGDPVLRYSELDAVRRETRKVEVSGDGRGHRAGPGTTTGATESTDRPEVIDVATFETAWRAAEIDALAKEFVSGFEERFGYPPDENGVVFARSPAGGACGALHDVVREVSLPDVGNGYFIHPRAHDARLTGFVEEPVTVFGSDGGGALFAVSGAGKGVYRFTGASTVPEEYAVRENGIAVVAPGLREFLDLLRDELRKQM